ncbi:phage terminase small subunit P27 family [Staphylococcus agnetis]|uniref:phage terminase small subunit P27 family n=1 Tax=Staphylococcus agnetis TaxID=985762 RepID=UPI0004E2F701|nr:phage terminase small subunit P27 family [Staphylococcus agnetis]KFE40745.1 Phage Terminase Small Subunit [Staphylococcus agnetis]NJH87336.1 phage terminase small subunit P27 family [Staphylococcus agnetis]NJI15711.1 phage terminase small subunit P27 family [Staphylococcus agnetis]PTH44770.1 phage terminase small subunit P27 family [Staphylococcus agnetis]PTH70402.1 phage terminase small subunit P27 family [Staphylococcus agnetis]
MAGRPKKLLLNSNKNYTKEEIIEKERQEAELNKFSKIDVTPPDFLDDIAKEEYKRIIPHMQELPISKLDTGQIAQYCSFYSDFVKASVILEQEDLMIVDDKGNQKVNPAFNVKEKAGIRMQQTANTLGLTIDSRLRIIVPDEKEDDDPFKQFASDD